MKPKLTAKLLCDEALAFAEVESVFAEPSLYGVDNGKAVGTYFEHKFQADLHKKYVYKEGSSAKGYVPSCLLRQPVSASVGSHNRLRRYLRCRAGQDWRVRGRR